MESATSLPQNHLNADATRAVTALLGDPDVQLPAAVRDVLAWLLGQPGCADDVVVVRHGGELSPSDAARMLGVSRQYVDRLVERGVLPARRLPGSRYRRIPVDAVLAHRSARLDRPAESFVDANVPADAGGSTDDIATTGSASVSPRTPRGRARRAQLVEATARLVAERGFHSVGINEIAAAAGVTGAAIYRHFPNKTQMLVAVLDQVVDELLDGSARILESDRDPTETLELLVRHHVQLVLRNPAVFGIYLQEAHNLPPEDRHRLRSNQRSYVLRWAELLRKLDPRLSADAARTRAQVTFGLLNSLAEFPSTLLSSELSALLTSMALASLRA